MSKHDLQARPIYHHQRDSIEAHLTIVFAALAVSRWIEDRTGWLICKSSAPPAEGRSRSRRCPRSSMPRLKFRWLTLLAHAMARSDFGEVIGE